MKTSFSVFSVSIAGFLFLTACSKQEESTPSAASQTAPASAVAAAPETPPTAPAAPPAVADNAPKVEPAAAADVKATADAAVTQATAPAAETIKAPDAVPAPPAVSAAPPAADSSVQGILERAKGLVADKKYSEALTTLSGLSTASLTADQQNLVAQLKAKISDAMAAKAGNEGLKSIGGLLDRKK